MYNKHNKIEAVTTDECIDSVDLIYVMETIKKSQTIGSGPNGLMALCHYTVSTLSLTRLSLGHF